MIKIDANPQKILSNLTKVDKSVLIPEDMIDKNSGNEEQSMSDIYLTEKKIS